MTKSTVQLPENNKSIFLFYNDCVTVWSSPNLLNLGPVKFSYLVLDFSTIYSHFVRVYHNSKSKSSQITRTPNFVRNSIKKSFQFPPSSSSNHPSPATACPASLLATYVSLLQTYARRKNISKGKQTHALILTNGFQSSPFPITSLINFYSKCGSPFDALFVFRGAESPNLVTWNCIVAGMVRNGLPSDGLCLYSELREKAGFLPCVINACCDLKMVEVVRKIHGFAFKVGVESDVFVTSALVNCFVKFDLVEVAEKVFEELSERDVVLWNFMVNGFAQVGRFEDALRFYYRMESEGLLPSTYTVTGIASIIAAMADLGGRRRIHELVKNCGYDSDVNVCNSLVDMYGKCGDVEVAIEVFENMAERDVFSIISVFQQHGDHEGALKLFDKMRRSGVRPDAVTISAVLLACAQMSALAHGREIHAYMIVNGFQSEDDQFVENSTIDMYTKCGSLHDVRSVFDRMESRDVASWKFMIGGYASHGHGSQALDLFSTMCEVGIAPDYVTFVGVLSACSHSGLIDRGRWFLEHMESDYKVVPILEHYSCMVDMLGRAGRLAEAHDMLVNMPVASNPVVWRAYTAACQVHGDTDRAVNAAKHLLEMEPEHGGSHVLGSAGKYENVLEVRLSMRNQKVRKIPGCSWIELRSGVHAFIVRDMNHPDSEQIYSMLYVLISRLRELGYAPDATQGE